MINRHSVQTRGIEKFLGRWKRFFRHLLNEPKSYSIIISVCSYSIYSLFTSAKKSWNNKSLLPIHHHQGPGSCFCIIIGRISDFWSVAEILRSSLSLFCQLLSVFSCLCLMMISVDSFQKGGEKWHAGIQLWRSRRMLNSEEATKKQSTVCGCGVWARVKIRARDWRTRRIEAQEHEWIVATNQKSSFVVKYSSAKMQF